MRRSNAHVSQENARAQEIIATLCSVSPLLFTILGNSRAARIPTELKLRDEGER